MRAMYTVVRFCADETCSDETLMAFGVRLSSVVPNTYDGRLDHAGHRFSFGVSRKDEWTANLAETMQLVRESLPLVEAARTLGIYVEIDTAVEPRDIQDRTWLSCSVPPEVSMELARAQINLTVTIYRGAWAKRDVKGFNAENIDDQAEDLENRLQLLLSCQPFASDDRKLARVYLAIAREFRDLLPTPLRGELESALASQGMGVDSRGSDVATRKPVALDDKALAFLEQIVMSAARPGFTIHALSDSIPVSFGIALGIPVGVMYRILAAEYPITPGD